MPRQTTAAKPQKGNGMRTLLILSATVAAIVAAAWLGGETLLARRAAALIAAAPAVDAASVAPLREVDRIGLALTDAMIETAAGPAAFPTLAFWAAPTRPNRFHATLPPRMTLPVAGRPQEVTAVGAGVSATVSPLHSMSLTEARLSSGPVAIAGAPALEGVSLVAKMAKLGNRAPRGARTAYLVTADVNGLTAPAVLAAFGNAGAVNVEEPLGAEGAARVYLDRPWKANAADLRPRVEGLETDKFVVTLGAASARLLGRVERDEAGFAAGTIHVYTADARAFLDAAAKSGAMPAGLVPLAATMLANLAAEPADRPEPATADAAATRAGAAAAAPAPPQPGEIRLPIVFQDGKATLGGMPIGPAPRLD